MRVNLLRDRVIDQRPPEAGRLAWPETRSELCEPTDGATVRHAKDRWPSVDDEHRRHVVHPRRSACQYLGNSTRRNAEAKAGAASERQPWPAGKAERQFSDDAVARAGRRIPETALGRVGQAVDRGRAVWRPLRQS